MDARRRALQFAGQTAAAGRRAYRQGDRRGRIDLIGAEQFWLWCTQCIGRSRQRAALARLDGRLLDDIGVTSQHASAEAARPFWR
jgi:uncharacterized protein YjiS (DUF1127 family)